MRHQIGTVEIVRVRIYPIDPELRHQPVPPFMSFTEVVVQPGQYPLYEDYGTRYWKMEGVIDANQRRLGDGAFSMHSGDVLSEDEVVFYSDRYGPDDWTTMIRAYEVHPDPALKFHITHMVLDGELVEITNAGTA